jgi:hypothetical protein
MDVTTEQLTLIELEKIVAALKLLILECKETNKLLKEMSTRLPPPGKN